MNLKKIIFSLTIVVATVIATSLFWEQVFVLSIIILALAFSKHRFYPIKRELVWFIITGFIGSIGESIIMLSGSWSYTIHQIINIPVWLPLLWGLAGTTGITLYQGISET